MFVQTVEVDARGDFAINNDGNSTNGNVSDGALADAPKKILNAFYDALIQRNARMIHMEKTEIKEFTHIVIGDQVMESKSVIYPDHFKYLMDNVNNLLTLGDIAPIETIEEESNNTVTVIE